MAEQFHFDPATYGALIRAEVPNYEQFQDRVADATLGVAARRILDLGAGTGETLRRVAALHPNADVVAFDESEAMLAVARAALPGATFVVARLQDRLPPGPFDLVVSSLAVHHIDAAGKADLFERIVGCLAPGGRFVLGDVVVPDDPADRVIPLEEGYDRPDRVADVLGWLAGAGLDAAVVWADRDLAIVTADRTS